MAAHDIVPTHLIVNALRDSGYKNAAYAIAELMDNSIQAGATSVELLCGERVEHVQQRSRTRISELAVLDNGCGMDADVLQMALQFGNGTRLNDYSGIGRFGMGLPSSSISQARRVDVWTWQGGPNHAIHTYIDIGEIESEELQQVPVPSLKPIPSIWREVGKTFEKTGTLVVWTSLDRILWRTAKAIIDNSELLIGRMYRYYLFSMKVQIRLASFDMDVISSRRKINEKYALPNDPLYLLPNTSCPAPWDYTPMFAQHSFQNTEFPIEFRGEIHTVKVRFSYAKEEARAGHNPGSQPHGRHANNNKGVSIVRAGRELELDSSWVDETAWTRERWWGAEVRFPPALDDLFGVTNNKQSARNFRELAKADLDDELVPGQTWIAKKEELAIEEDPRLPLFEIVLHLRKNISTIRRLLRAQGSTSKHKRHEDETSSSEVKGTQVTRKRIEEGHRGESDKQEEQQPPEKRQQEIASELVEHGATQNQAEQLAAQTVGSGLKYTFAKSSVSTPAFFNVQSRGGIVIISLNVDHPAYTHLVEVLQQNSDDLSEGEVRANLSNARQGLELLLIAWARYEDEQNGTKREQTQDVRWDWGRVARDFLYEEA
ncbi:MAG: ATP-binding protein [Chloroflexi bacterium]|nr:ATP-binding protein [Chloroflexota bacterium]